MPAGTPNEALGTHRRRTGLWQKLGRVCDSGLETCGGAMGEKGFMFVKGQQA